MCRCPGRDDRHRHRHSAPPCSLLTVTIKGQVPTSPLIGLLKSNRPKLAVTVANHRDPAPQPHLSPAQHQQHHNRSPSTSKPVRLVAQGWIGSSSSAAPSRSRTASLSRSSTVRLSRDDPRIRVNCRKPAPCSKPGPSHDHRTVNDPLQPLEHLGHEIGRRPHARLTWSSSDAGRSSCSCTHLCWCRCLPAPAGTRTASAERRAQRFSRRRAVIGAVSASSCRRA